jgi:hypothetical protein
MNGEEGKGGRVWAGKRERMAERGWEGVKDSRAWVGRGKG